MLHEKINFNFDATRNFFTQHEIFYFLSWPIFLILPAEIKYIFLNFYLFFPKHEKQHDLFLWWLRRFKLLLSRLLSIWYYFGLVKLCQVQLAFCTKVRSVLPVPATRIKGEKERFEMACLGGGAIWWRCVKVNVEIGGGKIPIGEWRTPPGNERNAKRGSFQP